jgi:hypothetical protein
MATYIYRLNGGQVLGQVYGVDSFAELDRAFYQFVTDPPTPDGVDLSVPKIYDGVRIRNATAPEQSAFVTAAAVNATALLRSLAVAMLQNDPLLRKVLSAIVDVMVQQINVLRTQPTTTFAAITKQQAKTAIINAINDGSND